MELFPIDLLPAPGKSEPSRSRDDADGSFSSVLAAVDDPPEASPERSEDRAENRAENPAPPAAPEDTRNTAPEAPGQAEAEPITGDDRPPSPVPSADGTPPSEVDEPPVVMANPNAPEITTAAATSAASLLVPAKAATTAGPAVVIPATPVRSAEPGLETTDPTAIVQSLGTTAAANSPIGPHRGDAPVTGPARAGAEPVAPAQPTTQIAQGAAPRTVFAAVGTSSAAPTPVSSAVPGQNVPMTESTPAPANGSTATPAPANGSVVTPAPANGSTVTPVPTNGFTATPAPANGSTATPTPTPASGFTGTPAPSAEPVATRTAGTTGPRPDPVTPPTLVADSPGPVVRTSRDPSGADSRTRTTGTSHPSAQRAVAGGGTAASAAGAGAGAGVGDANASSNGNAATGAIEQAQSRLTGSSPTLLAADPMSSGGTDSTGSKVVSEAPIITVAALTDQLGKPGISAVSATESLAATARATAQAPAMVEQIAVRISQALQDGISRLTINLQPPELGRVEVKIETGEAGRVHAAIVVDRPETLDLLQKDSRALERALQQAGLDAEADSLDYSLREDSEDGDSGEDADTAAGDGENDLNPAADSDPARSDPNGLIETVAVLGDAPAGLDIRV